MGLKIGEIPSMTVPSGSDGKEFYSNQRAGLYASKHAVVAIDLNWIAREDLRDQKTVPRYSRCYLSSFLSCGICARGRCCDLYAAVVCRYSPAAEGARAGPRHSAGHIFSARGVRVSTGLCAGCRPRLASRVGLDGGHRSAKMCDWNGSANSALLLAGKFRSDTRRRKSRL